MNEPAVAKITKPVTDRILERQELLRKLDNCRHVQMIWVTGPGGAGKTTLVNSYIETRKPDYLWYRMDRSDNDPASFFQYLGQAVENAFPDNNLKLPSFGSDLLFSINWFFLKFFNSLTTCLKPPAIIVFDNFQDLSEESPIYSAIVECLNRMPVGFRILIISRSEPPAAFARLRANAMLTLIGWKDLQLTQDEFMEIVKIRGRTQAFGEALLPLYNRLDGWAGGLSLLLDAYHHKDPDPVFPGTATPSACFDYFASEIFTKLPEQVRSFALKISIFPDMTAGMAADLTKLENAEEFLEQLLRNNHFTEKRPASPAVYLFHPLFHEFLFHHAEATFSKQEMHGLLKNGASILAEAGRYNECANLLTQAHAWSELEILILNQAHAMFLQGKHITLLKWINTLPGEKVTQSGWLLYWLGICQCPFTPSESRKVLNQAYDIFRKQENPIEIVLGWCAAELIHFIDCSDYTPLDRLIEDVFEFLPKIRDVVTPELTAMLGFHIFSALNMRQPQHPQMEIYAEEVDKLINIIPDISQRLIMGARLILYRVIQGKLREATRIAHILRPLAQDKALAPFPKLNWICGELIHAVATGDFQQGLQTMAEGEAMTREAGVRTTEGTILSMGAFSYLGQGNYKKADEYLDRMDNAILPGRFFEYALHRLQKALSLALQGELGKALETARVALDLIHQSGSPLIEPFIRFGIGQLYTELGDYQKAAHELEQAGGLGRALNSSLSEHLSLMYGAQLQFKQGHNTAGMDLLKRGLKLGREKRYFWFMWDRHDVMVDLYVKALRADIETEYVLEVIRKRGLIPKAPPVAVEKWPWPIRIYTLGRFELVMDGKPLPSTGKNQQKPLMLLKAILTLGGRKVGDERIVDFLWPDADGDFQAKSLKTTLHRLRKLLGNSNAVIFQDHQISLNPYVCWTDIWAFERLLDGNTSARIEKGLNLYKGPFFGQNNNDPWLISPKEKLRSKYLRGIELLAKLLEEKKQWRSAIVWYEKGLETEPLIEEFYQRIIICYQQLSRPAEARAVYQRCHNALTTGLGTGVSDKTNTIYRSL